MGPITECRLSLRDRHTSFYMYLWPVFVTLYQGLYHSSQMSLVRCSTCWWHVRAAHVTVPTPLHVQVPDDRKTTGPCSRRSRPAHEADALPMPPRALSLNHRLTAALRPGPRVKYAGTRVFPGCGRAGPDAGPARGPGARALLRVLTYSEECRKSHTQL